MPLDPECYLDKCQRCWGTGYEPTTHSQGMAEKCKACRGERLAWFKIIKRW